MRAHAAILMDQRKAAEKSVITDVHVPGQARCICKHGAMADSAIVRHVTIGHDKVVIADDGFTAAFDGATIQSAIFADSIAVSDLKTGRFALIPDVLRCIT